VLGWSAMAAARMKARTDSGWWRQASPVGDLLVVTNASGVVRLAIAPDPGEVVLDAAPGRDAVVAEQLDEYFAGTRKKFSVQVDLDEVDGFRHHVLETVRREVPWGETVSYGELADMVGAPRAARAVGTAMANNPVQVLVPCHRVIAAGGRVGGYGRSGASMKRALLAIEGVVVC
jgi:methylated-DNA-[protein]-cysteine S-methyltransferase